MAVKMLSTVGFHFLMDTYADKAVRDRSVCRFLFDGERLMAKETPKKVRLLSIVHIHKTFTDRLHQLDMVNNDCVEVFFEQLGG